MLILCFSSTFLSLCLETKSVLNYQLPKCRCEEYREAARQNTAAAAERFTLLEEAEAQFLVEQLRTRESDQVFKIRQNDIDAILAASRKQPIHCVFEHWCLRVPVLSRRITVGALRDRVLNAFERQQQSAAKILGCAPGDL